MSTVLKRVLIALIVILLITIAGVAAWLLFLRPILQPSAPGEVTGSYAAFERLAREEPTVDFNEKKGIPYVNNELIVIASSSAEPSAVAALAEEYKATSDDSLSDIGIYKFTLKDSKPYEDLEKLIKKIKESTLVEDVQISVVNTQEGDAEEFKTADPVFPNDSWNGASWNTSAPRDENWGMEAIDAPGAWGYLDRMSEVRIGLIDTTPNASHEDLSDQFADVNFTFIDTKTGEVKDNLYGITSEDHGSHVSGIMGASYDNNSGVSGVTGNKAKLYYNQVYYDTNGTPSSGYGTAYTYMLSLKRLIDKDVQVINISQNTSRLVGFAASRGNKNAINYLTLQSKLAQQGLSRLIAKRQAEGRPDFVICMAAGNSNATEYYKDDSQPYGYRETMTVWESIQSLFGWHGESGDSMAHYNNFLNLMDDEDVKARVIVVGSVGIDFSATSASATRYKYAYYSNVGFRVDVCAPGGIPGESPIYSCYASGYDGMCGTSMAAPHVSGVAGLVFASNPDLTGPQVKQIITSTAVGRYNYTGGHSGLVNAKLAVEAALKSKTSSVKTVLVNPEGHSSGALDLCFVVDTTGSMGSHIQNAKDNMTRILGSLSEKTSDYRVALVDYRDFASRTKDDKDYPSKIQLQFSDDDSKVQAAINALDLGYGGDKNETLYSGLMTAIDLDWRADAKKVIIVIGDAGPLDPEPETGYTYDNVLLSLMEADIYIDVEETDKRALDVSEDSEICVFSINTGSSSLDEFEKIAKATGGDYTTAKDASGMTDAIVGSIEKIEVVKTVNASVDFGDSLSGKRIDLYRDGEYQYTVTAGAKGKTTIDSMEPDSYTWKCAETLQQGSLEVPAEKKKTELAVKQSYWFNPVLDNWQQNGTQIWITCLILTVVLLLLPVSVAAVIAGVRSKPRKQPVMQQMPVNPAVPGAPVMQQQPQTPAQTSPVPPAVPAVSPAPPVVPAKPETPAPKAVTESKADAVKAETESVDNDMSKLTPNDLPTITKKKIPTPANPKTPKFCPICGSSLDAGTIFCANCGTRITPP